jgi:hypothetical protein
MSWTSYWARVWEPKQLGGRRSPPRSDADEGRSATAAPRTLPGGRGGPAARRAAAARLQQLVGNRAVARMVGPLPRASEIGARLGTDLSDVRVYHDAGAAAALGAEAFATRDRVVVAEPKAVDDPVLMAAEATHVAQGRLRGTRPGISQPNDASERQAHGDQPASSSGGPVPEIQRDAKGKPTVSIGALRPQVVRTMLELEFAAAGSPEGGIPWSPELEAAFGRLLPDTAVERIRALWDPPPPTTGVAFLRLVDAGIFPTLRPLPPGAPLPARAEASGVMEEPVVEEEEPAGAPVAAQPEVAVRPSMAMGIAGINIRVGRPPSPPPEAVVAAPFLERGIRLTDAQLRSLIASRDGAVQQFSRLLQTVPGLDEPTRLALARWMADLATAGSTRAEARSSRPTQLEHDAAATAHLPRPRPRSVLDSLPRVAPLPQLLDSLAGVGVTVTLHFDL